MLIPYGAMILVALGCAGLTWGFLQAIGLGRRDTIALLVRAGKGESAGRDGEDRGRTGVKTTMAAAAGSFLAAWVVFGGVALVLLFCALGGGYLLPRIWRWIDGDRRKAVLRRQIPEALDTIASALRAGRNLVRAVEDAAARIPPPLAGHLSGVARKLESGEKAREVFADLHGRLNLAETEMMEAAMRALAETGGQRMAEIMDTIAELARNREAARAEARASLSEQILVVGILSFLPVVVYYMIRTNDPWYFAALAETWTGQLTITLLAVVIPFTGGIITRRILFMGSDDL